MPASVRRREFLAGTLAVTAAAAVGTTPAAAQRPRAGGGRVATALGARLQSMLESFHCPGLGLAVTYPGGAEALAFGHASLPFDVRATRDTLWQLGSVGKHFTAIAVLQLAAQGRFALDEPIGRYLTDIPDTWQRRSISSLLHHLSGIPDYNVPTFDDQKSHTRAEVIAAAATRPTYFNEGFAWSYSNTNYMLLGWLIEQAAGATYAQYLTESVLRRAGLVHSRIDAAGDVIPQRAEPYVWRPETNSYVHATRMSSDYSGYPDGPMLMSPAEALLWERALTSGMLLPAAQWARMLEPARLNRGLPAPYGCAWFVDRTHGRSFQGHTGGVPGYAAFTLRMPETGVAVMVMSNGVTPSARLQRYVGHLAAETVAPGTTILALAPLSDDRPDLTAGARALLLREGAVDRANLGPELLLLVDGPLGERALPRSRAGDPQSFEVVEQRRDGPATFRRYRLTYPDCIDHYTFGYDADGRLWWVFAD